ncbi:MAG: hypothetical protein U5K69_13230 [Balneolaceae bacterium]|nr:hypothetical protein [Balneolaceae bacterium]
MARELMISISDSDIDKAQSLLLKGKGIFDSERRKVIQDLEGFDVQASPGSGKTTTLLAKLLLISEQLPLAKNRGICVLTPVLSEQKNSSWHENC